MWEFLNKFNIDVWCICLIERDDRFKYINEEFKKVGLNNVKFHRPLRNNDGAVGCLLSHKYCAEESKKLNTHALVFEDDAMFTDDFASKIPCIIEFLSSKQKWDVIRLGSAITSLHKPSDITDKIWKCSCYNNHAVIYNTYAIDDIFNSTNFIKNPHIDDYLHDNEYLDFSLIDVMCYQKSNMGTDINWFNNTIIQNIMQNEKIFSRLQRFNNIEMYYARFLPISIQEKISLWSIFVNIGFFTKWLYS